MPSARKHLGPGDLPVELILAILENLDLSDLYSAIRAAPIFNRVWRLHTASISAASLARSIECYPEALQLDQALQSTTFHRFESPLKRHNRLVLATKCVSAAYQTFLQDYLKEYRLGGRFRFYEFYEDNEEDRMAFKRAFYWFWRLALSETYRPTTHRRPNGTNPYESSQLSKPLDFPRRCTVFFVWGLLAYIRREAYRCLFVVLSKVQRVYGKGEDRQRQSIQWRWQNYSEQLWNDPGFVALRKKYWENDVLVGGPEPGVEYGWYERDTATAFFLERVREAMHERKLKGYLPQPAAWAEPTYVYY
ncbi:hypothetical protein G7Y79_00020g048310 [Physcia stellaris]|nr:hypothetical protein G7Y79_00020g048310 [Physcia stellaris]